MPRMHSVGRGNQEASAVKVNTIPLYASYSAVCLLVSALVLLLAQVQGAKGGKEAVGKGERTWHMPSLPDPCPLEASPLCPLLLSPADISALVEKPTAIAGRL